MRNDITTFDQIIGNANVKVLLMQAIESAKSRNESLDHVLITGPSGCGKTTFAEVIAHELQVPMEDIICSSKDIGKINIKLMKMQNRSILFLDEVHQLTVEMMESLYRYFDKGEVQFTIPGQTPVMIKAKQCTIISATTELSKLPEPYINRHSIHIKLNHYTTDELITIVKTTALRSYKLIVSDDASEVIARASKGTPRDVKSHLNRVRDHIVCNNITDQVITKNTVVDALNVSGIHENGFDIIDRQYIMTLFDTFNNVVTGISSIANQMQVDEKLLTNKTEPWLIREGYVIKSRQGRCLSKSGLEVAMQLYAIQ